MTHTQLPKEVTDARTALIVKHPWWAIHLMTKSRLTFDPAGSKVSTSGKEIRVGEWFVNLPLDQRVFVLAHEVAHDIFGHHKRARMYDQRGFGPDMTPFNHDRYAYAADAVINDLLVETKCGRMPTEGVRNGNITWDMTVDRAYELSPDIPPKNNFDEHMPEDGDDEPITDTELDQQVRDNVAAAMASAKAQGKLPAALARLAGDILEPKVSWHEELRDFITNLAGKDQATWARPHRRRLCLPPHIYYPGTDGCTIEEIVVAVDTSGSISETELGAFMGEMSGIVEQVRPRNLHVIWWDTAAIHQEVDDLSSVDKLSPYGGGGTDYTCVPAKIRELGLEPDVVVCFTDGYIQAGVTDVPYPHITVTTGLDMPFGKSIKLEA